MSLVPVTGQRLEACGLPWQSKADHDFFTARRDIGQLEHARPYDEDAPDRVAFPVEHGPGRQRPSTSGEGFVAFGYGVRVGDGCADPQKHALLTVNRRATIAGTDGSWGGHCCRYRSTNSALQYGHLAQRVASIGR